MTWYRTYRPTTVAGLHLTSVRQALTKLMEQGRLPQVLLFAGPKGTGKTSTARIVAAILNDPANQAQVAHSFFNQPAPAQARFQEPAANEPLVQSIFKGNSYIVQEMDAASHRGIDDVRAIREQVAVPPQGGTMSVYILDEVHMLTTEAFNALLKLLEEPPAHVVFILATTELHKIPATILSRATLIPFTKASHLEISQALTTILTAEQIEFEPGSLEVIARQADGSFRDAVKSLEQIAFGQKKITQAMAEEALHVTAELQIKQIIEAVLAKDPTQVSYIIRQLRETAVNPDYFLGALIKMLHQSLMQSLGVEPGQPVVNQAVSHFLLSELQQIGKSDQSGMPFLGLELKLLELIFRSQNKGSRPSAPASGGSTPVVTPNVTPVPSARKPDLMALGYDAVLTSTPVVSPPASVDLDLHSVALPTQQVVGDNIATPSLGDSEKLLAQWDVFVESMKEKNSSIAALLKSAKPLSAANGKAQIAVFYKFHQEQLQQPKFMMMIQECVKPMAGGNVTFEFILQQPVAVQSETQNLASLAEELLV